MTIYIYWNFDWFDWTIIIIGTHCICLFKHWTIYSWPIPWLIQLGLP